MIFEEFEFYFISQMNVDDTHYVFGIHLLYRSKQNQCFSILYLFIYFIIDFIPPQIDLPHELDRIF